MLVPIDTVKTIFWKNRSYLLLFFNPSCPYDSPVTILQTSILLTITAKHPYQPSPLLVTILNKQPNQLLLLSIPKHNCMKANIQYGRMAESPTATLIYEASRILAGQYQLERVRLPNHLHICEQLSNICERFSVLRMRWPMVFHWLTPRRLSSRVSAPPSSWHPSVRWSDTGTVQH